MLLTTNIFFHLMDKTGTWQKNLEAVHHCCIFLMYFFRVWNRSIQSWRRKGSHSLSYGKCGSTRKASAPRNLLNRRWTLSLKHRSFLQSESWFTTVGGWGGMHVLMERKRVKYSGALVEDQHVESPPLLEGHWWETTLVEDNCVERPPCW